MITNPTECAKSTLLDRYREGRQHQDPRRSLDRARDMMASVMDRHHFAANVSAAFENLLNLTIITRFSPCTAKLHIHESIFPSRTRSKTLSATCRGESQPQSQLRRATRSHQPIFSLCQSAVHIPLPHHLVPPRPRHHLPYIKKRHGASDETDTIASSLSRRIARTTHTEVVKQVSSQSLIL